MLKIKRPNWDEYFLQLTGSVAARSTCDRGRSGAVAVKDKQILTTGYVGAPVSMPHCDDVGHQIKKMVHEDGRVSEHCVRTVHAEQNLICQAAKNGVSLNGATVYCRMTPCRVCAMLLINSGIKRVVCQYKYHEGMESEDIFKQAGIDLIFQNNEILDYKKQK